MLISQCSLYTKKLPLKTPFKHASSGWITELEEVYLKLESESGIVGYGEVRGNCEYFGGETTETILSVARTKILPLLLKLDPRNLNHGRSVIDRSIPMHYAAKALCDIALHDLSGKIQKVSVHDLLGGKLKDELNTEENIPFCSPEETGTIVRQYLRQGCRFVKLRVGHVDFSRDLERVRICNQAIEELKLTGQVSLGADVNQAWDAKEAIKKIKMMEREGVGLVEQPIPRKDIFGLKNVRDNVDSLIFADESVFDIQDLAVHIQAQAIDGFHLKLVKCGGISNAVRMIHIAEAHGIHCLVGGMDEGALAVAAAVHCGAIANTDHFELHGNSRVAEDPASGLRVEEGNVQVPKGPGLGITIDEEMLCFKHKV